MAIRRPPTCKLATRLADNLLARKGQTLILEEFCKEVGLSKSSLARVLSGNQNVTLTTLQRMCDRLECDIGDLFKAPQSMRLGREGKGRKRTSE